MTGPAGAAGADRRTDLLDLKRRVPLVDLLARDGVAVDVMRRVSIPKDEHAGPCPVCPDGGDDRFHLVGAEGEGGRFFCRRCHERHGDQIEYLEWRHGLSTRDAIARLQDYAGVPAAATGRPAATATATATATPSKPAARPKASPKAQAPATVARPGRPGRVPGSERVTEYPYVDAQGELRAVHRRIDFQVADVDGDPVLDEATGEPRTEKDVFWLGPDRRPSGGRVHPRDLPLYNLETLASPAAQREDATVLFVEGEKCVGVGEALGYPTVTTGHGAQSGRIDFGLGGRMLAPLAGKRVTLLPDQDEPGVSYMAQVGLALFALGCSLVWLAVPAVPAGGDLADWAAQYPHEAAARKALAVLLERAPAWTPGSPGSPETQGTTGSQRMNGQTTTTSTPPATAPDPGLHLTSWADKAPRLLPWAPGGYSAVGGLNVFAGDGGTGKTRLVMSGAAARTRGQRWPVTAGPCPDGIEVDDLPPGVLFCGAEDAVESVLLPAFLHAGGDQRRVASIDGVFVPGRNGGDPREVGFDLSERALEALDNTLAGGEYGEVIIDGLTGYVAGDGMGDTETRRSLLPLAILLRRHEVIGTALMHFGKGAKRAADKLLQSVAFRNVPRTVYFIVPDPQEAPGGTPERPDYRRLLFSHKVNGGRLREPVAFRVADVAVPHSDVRTGGILWDTAPVDCSLNEALREADATPEQAGAGQGVPQAVLTATLTIRGGWAPARDVLAAGEAVGVPERTLQYARKKHGLRVRRVGNGPGSGFWWGLPAAPEEPPLSIVSAFPGPAPHRPYRDGDEDDA